MIRFHRVLLALVLAVVGLAPVGAAQADGIGRDKCLPGNVICLTDQCAYFRIQDGRATVVHVGSDAWGHEAENKGKWTCRVCAPWVSQSGIKEGDTFPIVPRPIEERIDWVSTRDGGSLPVIVGQSLTRPTSQLIAKAVSYPMQVIAVPCGWFSVVVPI